jgi:Skp family chaperone for outer membrane proteins
MTRSLLAVVTFGCLTAAATLASAQSRPVAPLAPTSTAPASNASAEPASGRGTQVALIDIGYIFRKHPGFVAKRDALRDKQKQLVAQENAKKKQWQLETEKLKDFARGSLEAKQLEAQLTQQASDLQVQAQLSQKESIEQDAKLHYEMYMEVQRVIDRVAEEYNIDVVYNFSREPMDPTNPDSIRKGLFNQVVYQRRLDITDIVMEKLPVERTANVIAPKTTK